MWVGGWLLGGSGCAKLIGYACNLLPRRLNGDKDTWVLGMMYTKHKLEPLPTTPGFLFIDYLGDSWGRKVHGQVRVSSSWESLCHNSELIQDMPATSRPVCFERAHLISRVPTAATA